MAWWNWLIVIVALLAGFAAGWVVRERRDVAAAGPVPSTVDGEPVAGTTAVVATPAPDATTDSPRPEATVDPSPSALATVEDPAEQVDHADMALTGDPVPAPEHATTAAPADAPAGRDTEVVLPAAAGLTGPVDEATPARGTDPAHAEEQVPAQAEVPVPVPADEPVVPRDEETVVPAAEPVTAAETAAEEPAPAVVPAARDGEATPAVRPVAGAETADDFRRIQGVGPKMAAALQAAGITTYQQLSELDEAALRETVRAAGLRATASLATWPQQAKLLAGAAQESAAVLPAGVGGEDA